MADLSQLSDEQLQVYKEMLAGKSSDKVEGPTTIGKIRNFLGTGDVNKKINPDTIGEPPHLPPNLERTGMVLSLLDPAIAIARNPGGIINLGKSLYEGIRAGGPKIAGGAGLAAVGGGAEAATEGMTGLPHYARYLASYPGIKMMGQGMVDAAKGFGSKFNPAPISGLLSDSTDIAGMLRRTPGRVVPPVARPDVIDLSSTPGMGLPSGRVPGSIAAQNVTRPPTPTMVDIGPSLERVPITAPPQGPPAAPQTGLGPTAFIKDQGDNLRITDFVSPKGMQVEHVPSAPSSFVDSESTGLQIPQHSQAKDVVAKNVSDFLHANNVTVDQIEAMAPDAQDAFWRQQGKVQGVSKQGTSYELTDPVTKERILKRLSILESGSAPQPQ